VQGGEPATKGGGRSGLRGGETALSPVLTPRQQKTTIPRKKRKKNNSYTIASAGVSITPAATSPSTQALPSQPASPPPIVSPPPIGSPPPIVSPQLAPPPRTRVKTLLPFLELYVTVAVAASRAAVDAVAAGATVVVGAVIAAVGKVAAAEAASVPPTGAEGLG
jgi:hypothetical protein